jgi:hypothetical protein
VKFPCFELAGLIVAISPRLGGGVPRESEQSSATAQDSIDKAACKNLVRTEAATTITSSARPETKPQGRERSKRLVACQKHHHSYDPSITTLSNHKRCTTVAPGSVAGALKPNGLLFPPCPGGGRAAALPLRALGAGTCVRATARTKGRGGGDGRFGGYKTQPTAGDRTKPKKVSPNRTTNLQNQ